MSNHICKTISIDLHAIVCQCFISKHHFTIQLWYPRSCSGMQTIFSESWGWPVDSPHKEPLTRKCFYLMTPSWVTGNYRFLSCILGNALRFCAVSHLKRVAPRIWLEPDLYNALYFHQRDLDLSELKDLQHFYQGKYTFCHGTHFLVISERIALIFIEERNNKATFVTLSQPWLWNLGRVRISLLYNCPMGALLHTWINFNHSMDK